MATLLISIGFALLLFVPVAVAMVRMRERDGDASVALTLADGAMEQRIAERLMVMVHGVAGEGMVSELAVASRAVTIDDEERRIEWLVDQARASRAYAEDLLMLARQAMERAEAADGEARGFEQDAALAVAARRAA